MVLADVYRPEQWHDYFVMVGGAAAALTGLVFVALSLNLVILGDAMHRARSVGTLTNFGGIFVVCALALMGGQGHAAIGVEWLVVSVAAGVVYAYPWPATMRARRSTLTVVRFTTGSALYLAEIAGALVLLLGIRTGLYVAAGSMTLLAAYSVSGAWLLLVSTRKRDEEETAREN
jgi:hypothetical protein